MIAEKEHKNRDELFRLMEAHPDLPVVPMVDSEIVPDDCCLRWEGSWGMSYIGEYAKGDFQIYLRNDNADEDEIANVLVGCRGDVDYYDLPEAELKKAYESLPWVKAIIVNIDLPN